MKTEISKKKSINKLNFLNKKQQIHLPIFKITSLSKIFCCVFFNTFVNNISFRLDILFVVVC